MTEKEIIRGCQRRKQKYQRALVDRYSPMLMTVCRRYAGSAGDAKDILQEGLIKILNGISKYKHNGSFEAWMRRIVVNTALQSFQHKWNKNEVYGMEIPDSEVPPSVYSQLREQQLLKMIESLPDGYRQILNLYCIEGHSHQEIAQMLKITESTSRSQLVRARRFLAAKIDELEKVQR